MNGNTVVKALGLLVLAGAGLWFYWSAQTAGGGPGGENLPGKPTSTEAPKTLQGEVQSPTKAPPRPRNVKSRITPIRNPETVYGMTRLPDGTYLPNLNGVKDKFDWRGQNFTPVVDIVVNTQGVEHWLHEDGQQSATVKLKMWNNAGQLIEREAFKMATPKAPVPMDPRIKMRDRK